MMYKLLHRSAPRYLGAVVPVTNRHGRWIFRSVLTSRQVVPLVKLPTTGSLAFMVAGPQTWNDWPDDVKAVQSLETFRQRLTTFLFCKSYPAIILKETSFLFSSFLLLPILVVLAVAGATHMLLQETPMIDKEMVKINDDADTTHVKRKNGSKIRRHRILGIIHHAQPQNVLACYQRLRFACNTGAL
jgi:hypothetical protein